MINRDSERIPLSVAQRQTLKKVYDYYGASGVIDKVDKYLFDKDLLLIGEDGANLINRSTPIAFIAKGKYWVNNHAHVLDVCGGLNLAYIALFINAISLVNYVTGTAQPKMNQEKMNSILVTVPPISEQARIVNQIESLQPLIIRYDKAQSELNILNTSVKEQLKKSILQEAIQGHLVPQIVEEGTAEELLAEIRKEKKRLVNEGKLKKSALNDSIIFKGDDNKYYEQINGQAVQIECDYDFPYSWSLVRLSSICSLIDGEKKEGQQLCLDAKFLRGKSAGEYQQRGKFVHKGDNIILVDGENSGEVFTVPCDGYMGSTFKQLWVSSAMHLPYVLNYYSILQGVIAQSLKRGAAIPHLNKEIFYSLIIGIPPYREQTTNIGTG